MGIYFSEWISGVFGPPLWRNLSFVFLFFLSLGRDLGMLLHLFEEWTLSLIDFLSLVSLILITSSVQFSFTCLSSPSFWDGYLCSCWSFLTSAFIQCYQFPSSYWSCCILPYFHLVQDTVNLTLRFLLWLCFINVLFRSVYFDIFYYLFRSHLRALLLHPNRHMLPCLMSIFLPFAMAACTSSGPLAGLSFAYAYGVPNASICIWKDLIFWDAGTEHPRLPQ